ncbi:MAG: polyphosphate kinase 2, partial [Pseudomonadota bacterium]
MTPFDADHAPPVTLNIRGKKRLFDIDDPDLPKWVEEISFSADHYPYTKPLDKKKYKSDLKKLHIELVKLQYWQEATGKRIICLFEGRDAAGKGGSIKAMRENLSPRRARIVALPKPS